MTKTAEPVQPLTREEFQNDLQRDLGIMHEILPQIRFIREKLELLNKHKEQRTTDPRWDAALEDPEQRKVLREVSEACGLEPFLAEYNPELVALHDAICSDASSEKANELVVVSSSKDKGDLVKGLRELIKAQTALMLLQALSQVRDEVKGGKSDPKQSEAKPETKPAD